ncbi:MAG: hypothetical protein QM764_04595 [Chitinophagaceae bacterium]
MNKGEGTNQKGNKRNQFRTNKQFKAQKVAYRKPKSDSKTAVLFDSHKDDLGNEYSLNDIIEIGYPIIETCIDVISSGKPTDILQEIHILLIELIDAGIASKEALVQFLGISENDFILDELFALLENGILAISEDDKYRVTTKGEMFISEKKFIPVTTQEDFRFYIDGLSKEIFYEMPSETTNSSNRIAPSVKVDFNFIQEQWLNINKCFTKANSGDKEIVDLANYKRSITARRDLFIKYYVLIYYPKDKSGKKVQLKIYNSDSKLLKSHSESLSALYSTNKYLFDFSNELEGVEEYKKLFIDTTAEITDDKLTGKYQDISTFEHKELIKEALFTAETAVYIESPWIRKATMEYLPGMEFFLKKKNTKLFIAYGIDASSKNAPHKDTFDKIEELKLKYNGRVYLFHLPSHFKTKFPNRNGSHRKILIKDFEYYVKGSYNWLSYSGNENENYAVEEGTQFFDNVEKFWKRVFKDYKLDESQLDFTNKNVK